MRIAVFYGEPGDSELDMTNPYNGNPGIGGVDFRLWMMPYYLLKRYNDVHVDTYLVEQRKYPKELHTVVVKDIYEALTEAAKRNSNIFLCRNLQTNNVYQFMNRSKLSIVLTAGNFISPEEQKCIKNCKAIKKVVCVGKQQYQMLCDTEIFDKCTYIYNSIDTRLYNYDSNVTKKNIVAYLGGLYPTKGFHILARNWRYIKKAVPDAQLYVIGSGKLYSKKKRLGAYGIAEEEYEKKFIKYLIDGEGHISKDVHFCGTLGGDEKLDVMKKCKVGVVNPSGETETFCYSAIEFEALGVPTVSKAKNGMFDTIKHRYTGILVDNNLEMVCAIISLLVNTEMNHTYSKHASQFVKRTFSVEHVIQQWYYLLNALVRREYSYDDKKNEKLSKHNQIPLRKMNATLQKNRIFGWIPSISAIQYRKYY